MLLIETVSDHNIGRRNWAYWKQIRLFANTLWQNEGDIERDSMKNWWTMITALDFTFFTADILFIAYRVFIDISWLHLPICSIDILIIWIDEYSESNIFCIKCRNQPLNCFVWVWDAKFLLQFEFELQSSILDRHLFHFAEESRFMFNAS